MRRINLILVAVVIAVLTSFPSRAQSPWLVKAKEEGEAMVYGGMQVSQMQVLIKNFEKRYPFLKVKYYRATGEKLAQRIVTETKAGRHLADVYQMPGAEIFMLRKMGYLSQYESPERIHIRDIYKDKDGYLTGVYANLEFIGYNKTRVSFEEAPKTHKDLLNPKWKGKIGMDMGDVDWYITQIHVLGEDKGKEFMRRFAQQEIQFRRGHTLLAQLLAAGEFSLTTTLRENSWYALAKAGAPIDWVAFEPVIPNPPNFVALPKQPPHPNAARLFLDYVLSREGQEFIRDFGRNITRTDLDPIHPRIKNLRFGKIDWPYYFSRYGDYEKEFHKTFLEVK